MLSGIVLSALYFVFPDWSSNFTDKFLAKEIELLAMKNTTYSINDDVMLHGRMGRFKRHFNYFTEQNLFNIFFGGLSIKNPYMLGHGTHNDYLRILFSTGILGLLIYLLFLGLLILKSISVRKACNRFLFQSGLIILILYSFTLTPSTYIDLNLFLMPTFIYLLKYNERTFNN